MAMRTKVQRVLLLGVDQDQLDSCAKSRGCSVQQFVALALADAMGDEIRPEQDLELALIVDGWEMRINISGGLGAE